MDSTAQNAISVSFSCEAGLSIVQFVEMAPLVFMISPSPPSMGLFNTCGIFQGPGLLECLCVCRCQGNKAAPRHPRSILQQGQLEQLGRWCGSLQGHQSWKEGAGPHREAGTGVWVQPTHAPFFTVAAWPAASSSQGQRAHYRPLPRLPVTTGTRSE
jgi:hypothetical protein